MKQVLTEEEIMACMPGAVRLPRGWLETTRAIESAVLAKLEAPGESVAWLCRKDNGELFAITEQFRIELGYGNISTKPFVLVAPLYLHTQQAVPEGLPSILEEAADILSGEKEMRFTIADELHGFALMLAAAPSPEGEKK